jgi:hypothetical protein
MIQRITLIAASVTLLALGLLSLFSYIAWSFPFRFWYLTHMAKTCNSRTSTKLADSLNEYPHRPLFGQQTL